MTNKPREFWLIENEGPSEAGFPVTRAYSSKQRFIRTEPKPQIHVIEAGPTLEKIKLLEDELNRWRNGSEATANKYVRDEALVQLTRVEAALQKCKEQRDEWLKTDYAGDEIHQADMDKELESILEGK